MLPVLYSFRRCPYAMRARWALLITGQIVEIREVDLKAKPKELIQVSPQGTVPTLVINEKLVINESLDIMIWAFKNSKLLRTPQNKYLPIDKAVREIIDQNDGVFKYHLDRFKYTNRFIGTDKLYHRDKARDILLNLNSKLLRSNSEESNWLTGCKETLADLSLWPFVRQYLNADSSFISEHKELIYLKKWLLNYIDNENFKKIMIKIKPWIPEQKRFILPSI